MRKMRILSCHLVLLRLVVLTARTQRSPDQPSVPDPHHHPVPVHQKPWQNDLTPDARFMRLQHPVAGHDIVLSPNGRWRAFIHELPNESGGRVRIQEMQPGKLYELRGIPLPYRPISGLIWLDDTLLTFDRWSQPHYGIHYVVDVNLLRLVLSTPFPDEFFLREQGVIEDSIQQHR